MSNLTYRDIPVLRSLGFEAGASGWTWFKKDKDGNLWQASEDEDTSNLLTFRRVLDGSGVRMSRERFDELFN